MTLELNDLAVDCIIGDLPSERMRAQRLVLAVRLEISDKAAESDELADTVDYAALAARIRAALVAARCRMIERAASVAIDACLEDPKVLSVRVKVVKAGAVPAYYKKENSTLEMDFFLRSGDDIVPVEVKAGNTKAKSMRMLLDGDHYKDVRWGIKLVKGNVGFNNGVLTIPQWCAFFLQRLVKDPARRFA